MVNLQVYFLGEMVALLYQKALSTFYECLILRYNAKEVTL